jgi:hypothetical protein
MSGAITARSTKKEKGSIEAASEPLPREWRGEQQKQKIYEKKNKAQTLTSVTCS